MSGYLAVLDPDAAARMPDCTSSGSRLRSTVIHILVRSSAEKEGRVYREYEPTVENHEIFGDCYRLVSTCKDELGPIARGVRCDAS